MGYEPAGQVDRSHQWGQWVVWGGHWWVDGRPFEAGGGPFDGRCIIWGGQYAV